MSVYTFDSDFEEIVNHLGGSVGCPNLDNKASQYQVERFMLHLHPNVDGFGKSMTLKVKGDTIYNYSERVTCKMICDKYNISWHIAHNTYFISPQDGGFYEGVDAIVENADKLPNELELIKADNRNSTLGQYFLSTSDYSFFESNNYKLVRFDNITD